jgi:tetratricopeptide (TPR) repeat protein
LESEEYVLAIDILRGIESYKDSSALVEENIFLYAKNLMANKQYKEAIEIFEANENTYEEARALRQEASYYYALELSEKENYEEALEYFDKAFKFADTQDKKIEIKYKYACELMEMEEFSKAIALFSSCSEYMDSESKANDAKYQYALKNSDVHHQLTHNYLTELKKIGYPNAKELYDEYYSWKIAIKVTDDMSGEYEDVKDKSVIGRYSEVYFYLVIERGEPNETMDITLKAIAPNETIIQKWDNANVSIPCLRWFYTDYYKGPAGDITVYAYDNHNNIIGQKTVTII